MWKWVRYSAHAVIQLLSVMLLLYNAYRSTKPVDLYIEVYGCNGGSFDDHRILEIDRIPALKNHEPAFGSL